MATKLTFKQFFHTWTQELLKWLTNKFDSIQIDTSELAKQGTNPDATNTAILAAIPVECSNEDIDRMFETTTEDGQIIVPSGLITDEGTMPVSVFSAVTGLTPTE